MTLNVRQLRVQAVAQSLFQPTSLRAAISRLGFIQADPIKSPATAQDLTLRHRVKDYHAGDLERRYAMLDIEEDYLYAYGFVSRSIWHLLHPRNATSLPKLEKQVLETVRKLGEIHPRDLEEHFGSERVINAWGGHSKATTRALDDLHYRGLLRIVRREKGIRVYQITPPFTESITPMERSRKLIMVIANIFAPAQQKSLQETIARLRYASTGLGDTKKALQELLSNGELQKQTIDDVVYIAPSFAADWEAPPTVKFLAPFDPVVWDRRRFEHLWGWPYRFEAYTPIAKRERGYYAMPLLWRENVIGWVNVFGPKGGLEIDVGFVKSRPKEAAFRSALDAEIESLKQFLRL